MMWSKSSRMSEDFEIFLFWIQIFYIYRNFTKNHFKDQKEKYMISIKYNCISVSLLTQFYYSNLIQSTVPPFLPFHSWTFLNHLKKLVIKKISSLRVREAHNIFWVLFDDRFGVVLQQNRKLYGYIDLLSTENSLLFDVGHV